MRHILVYGDSMSWGLIPTTRKRLNFEERWPGVLEIGLNSADQHVRVVEDCLNGRRTVWEDPFKPGRNGSQGLAQRIETLTPLSLVIVMLGINDFQSMHQNDAWLSSQGLAVIINTIRQAPIEPGMQVPPILIVAPPLPGIPRGAIAPKFAGCEGKCIGLADAYKEVAAAAGCHFFDAGSVVTSSEYDGVHLDADQHLILGWELVGVVSAVLK
ncbi:SGNH/GDSL hydrolase family protein [Undibacterium umbellatum]|jgi:lysophospholipase L1-like esterase|uniref:SGNH/GDSL hydrolase family protein n=1 Tax=Undibacterium umbellatum TaxID=2762300 RepID=A0ABR6Z9D9_9BURK|nr:SGNH/GDSL hydrolase family protein [Undibacterium umbellatum]MBC3908385.1 SGNH/GDSL hydrolase family protein [Undibacterium umbellatum]